VKKKESLISIFTSQLVDEISKARKYIELAGIVGSRLENPNKEGSDLDVVLIFRSPPEGDPANLKAYSVLERVMRRIRVKFSKLGTLLIFPTFRLSAIFKKFSKAESCLLVHLIVYPSLEYMLEIEQADIVESFARNMKIIYGDPNYRTKLHVRYESMRRRLVPYLALFSDVFQVVNFCGLEEFDEEFVIAEGVDKICYLTKYLLRKLVYELYGKRIEDWGALHKLSLKLMPRSRLLHKVNDLMSNSPRIVSVAELRSLLKSVGALLNRLYAYA